MQEIAVPALDPGAVDSLYNHLGPNLMASCALCPSPPALQDPQALPALLKAEPAGGQPVYNRGNYCLQCGGLAAATEGGSAGSHFK